MARFDVYADAEGRLYVDVQADLLSDLNTRVVIPLLPVDAAPIPARRMNPQVSVNGIELILATQYLAAVRRSSLGPVLTSLKTRGDDITAALDFVLQGF